MNAETEPNCAALGFDRARILATISLLGLDAEHGKRAARLRSEFIDGKAEALVSSCMDALARNQDFSLVERHIGAESFKQSWIHHLRGFGQNFDAPRYFEDRLGIAAEWARAGIPLGILQLQHSLTQQVLVDSLALQCRDDPEVAWSLVDCVLKLTSLGLYLTAVGYRLPEVGELQKALDKLREEVSRLHHKATTDQLTGVLSYSSLMETLEHQVDKAKQKDNPLCVMMADLDFFKKVNDTYGHLVGDLVLRHTAERIQAAVRDFDVVGRFGGEEFVIILKNTDLALARVIAERIREEVAGTPFHAKEFNIGVTISLGVAMYKKGECLETLLERADVAMYQAKKDGRNRVAVADDFGAVL